MHVRLKAGTELAVELMLHDLGDPVMPKDISFDESDRLASADLLLDGPKPFRIICRSLSLVTLWARSSCLTLSRRLAWVTAKQHSLKTLTGYITHLPAFQYWHAVSLVKQSPSNQTVLLPFRLKLSEA